MTRKRDLAEVHAALDALASASIDDPTALRDLLESVLVVSQGLELDQALQRIVDVAARVLDARYVALGVRASELICSLCPHRHHPGGAGDDGLAPTGPRRARFADQ